MKIPFPSKFAIGNFSLAFMIFAVSSTILYNQRFNLESLVRANLNGPLSLMRDWQLTEWLSQYAWGPFSAMFGYSVYWLRGLRNKSGNLESEINEVKATQIELKSLFERLEGLYTDVQIDVATLTNLVSNRIKPTAKELARVNTESMSSS